MILRSRRAARVLAAALLLGLVLAACKPAPPLGSPVPSQAQTPNIPNIADPSVLLDNGTYYVYGSNNFRFTPVTRISDPLRIYDLVTWQLNTTNAMPTLPAWATIGYFWAPSVAKFGNQYVMFFAMGRQNAPDPNNRECIGRAVASSPVGPFTPEPAPFSCGLGGTGGALDPSVFTDAEGKHWLHAAFGNTNSPIYALPLNAAGDALFGRPGGYAAHTSYPVLGRTQPWEAPFIENPSMVFDPSTGTYLLAYSAGDWRSANYSTGLARCSTPTGMCTKLTSGPWLSRSASRTGPGGLSFFPRIGGGTLAVYASYPPGSEGTGGRRQGTVQGVDLGWSPRLTG